MMRQAVITMDLEDWYHLDYFKDGSLRSPSMLDGLTTYLEMLSQRRIPSTIFVLGEVADPLRDTLAEAAEAGHEIASHGPDHRLVRDLSVERFAEEMNGERERYRALIGAEVVGYRAPCFSLEQPHLEALMALGFRYDASWLDFPEHPLVGRLSVHEWKEVRPGVRRAPGSAPFFEFQTPTVHLTAQRRLPIGGGAYFRFLPWSIYRRLVQRYISDHRLFSFYIHPFELSDRATSEVVTDAGLATRLRFGVGRRSAPHRFGLLLDLLQQKGYTFTTFREVASDLS